MGDNTGRDHGREIGEIVRSALSSGDLTRLKDLGPAVQQAAQDISKTVLGPEQAPGEAGKTAAQPQQQAPSRPAWQGQSAPAKQDMPGKNAGYAPLVLGIVGITAFGLASIIFTVLALVSGLGGVFWPLAGGFLAAGALAAVAAGRGSATRKLVARVKTYDALLAEKPVLDFDEVAARLGVEAGEVRRDIRKARKKGMLPDVRVDATESCMMRGEEAYRQYLETEGARKEREAEQAARARRMGDPQTAAIEAFKQEGEQTIRQIRLANDAIPGEEISEKLAKLEKTTARIFDYVEQHPEKLPDTRKFLSYYLPTTLKLVEKYRQYDEMEPQPAAVVKAKAEIEATLDTIDVAFNNLLESLYHEDTLDVATDIRVLEQMLEQEGLTKKQFELDAD